MPKLLIIDDEPAICFAVEQVLVSEELVVLSAGNAADAVRVFREELPDIVLLDVRLGESSGLEVFQELKRIDPKCLTVFITGHGTTDTAIEAMKLGAYDYFLKPLDLNQLKQVVAQGLQISRLMHVPAVVDDVQRAELGTDRLVGSGPAMQGVCKRIGRLAPQDVNVLILGESGTGKELVARAIYHHSRRAEGPFLAINCAAIPETLLEDELFGHERGAFTGAERRRIGKFEQCHRGTIFLDEIGDMPAHTQAKILRLLQEGRFERLGGNESISVDVRILAATNQDLDRMIAEGGFRRDLYYRLRGATIHLPPLRERRADLPELAHYFLFRFNRLLGTAVQSISQEAMELLEAHDWPGNVRELENSIREALIASLGPTILPDFLPREIVHSAGRDTVPPNPAVGSGTEADFASVLNGIEAAINDGQMDVYRRARDQFDRILIALALRKADGNQHRTAELLGISRVTLRARLRALGMSADRGPKPE